MAKVKPITSEWAHLVDANKIGTSPLKISIEPTSEQRKLLARRLGLKSLESLKAEITFTRAAGKMTVYAEGSFEAQVNQHSAVSAKTISSKVSDCFEAWFADREKTVPFVRALQEKEAQKGKMEMPMIEEADDPEPIIDGKIDAGELVTQFLSLAINPYPHAEGEEYPHGDDTAALQKRLDNPFAALKQWKSRKIEE
jgi:hypothetical protein